MMQIMSLYHIKCYICVLWSSMKNFRFHLNSLFHSERGKCTAYFDLSYSPSLFGPENNDFTFHCFIVNSGTGALNAFLVIPRHFTVSKQMPSVWFW